MGTSTNGQICYGIAFEEVEFPWDKEHEGDYDDWWIYSVHGFKHSVELYGADGNYLNGREPSNGEVDKYFAEKREFAKANPLPVELVNYCSNDYPMYVLAVPSTVITARRGVPEEFHPHLLSVTHEGHDALLKFCSNHGIEVPEEPKWLLTSYWG